jgi:predicted DsbA family dithiol-disulfide isomerase
MKIPTRIAFAALATLLFACELIMAGGAGTALPGEETHIEPREVIFTGAPVLGDINAPVIMIGYSDYRCPYCQRHSRQTMPEIIDRYIDEGKLRFIVREYPIQGLRSQSSAASLAALCAGGQGKYWEMHAILVASQAQLTLTGLQAIAVEIDLDTESFNHCLTQRVYAGQIEKDMAEGSRMGIQGTPSFVLGLADPADPGRVMVTRFIHGARDFDYFVAVIDELLASEFEAGAAGNP